MKLKILTLSLLLIICNNFCNTQDLQIPISVDFGECTIGIIGKDTIGTYYSKIITLKNNSDKQIRIYQMFWIYDMIMIKIRNYFDFFGPFVSLGSPKMLNLNPGDSINYTILFGCIDIDSISKVDYLTEKLVFGYFKENDSTQYFDTVSMRAKAIYSRELGTMERFNVDRFIYPDQLNYNWYMNLYIFNRTDKNYFIDSITVKNEGTNFSFPNLFDINLGYRSNWDTIRYPMKFDSNTVICLKFDYTNKNYEFSKSVYNIYSHEVISGNVEKLRDSILINLREDIPLSLYIEKNFIMLKTDSIIKIRAHLVNYIKNSFYLDSVVFSDIWKNDKFTFSFDLGQLPFKLENSFIYPCTITFTSHNLGYKTGTVTLYFRDSLGKPFTRVEMMKTYVYITDDAAEKPENNKKFIIYPNPANDRIFINSSLLNYNENYYYQINNSIGILQKSGNLPPNNKSINVEELGNGLFFLKIFNRYIHNTIKFLIYR